MTHRADAIVVGSGPAGSAAASALVGAGVDVLMLEAGARPQADRFTLMRRAVLNRSPWEFPPYLYEMSGDDIELNEFALRMLGGSSLAWGAITPRFLPRDFQLRSAYGIARDWPIGSDELEPYYCRAERFMGVSGAEDNPWSAPRSEPFPMGPFPMNDTDLLVKEAGKSLGIRFHSVPVARNSVPYDRRSACQYYGTCRACPIGAMFGSDRVCERLELQPGFRLLTEADVTRVEVGEGGRARQVIYVTPDGLEHAAEADRIILAVQAVETVRILLNSACPGFTNGLANNNGVLGLGFMEHAKLYVEGRVDRRLMPFRQGFETATTYQFCDHPERGDYAGGRLLVREAGGRSVPDLARLSGKWGWELKEEIRREFGFYVRLGAFLEQLPDDRNCITLAASRKGRNGMPAPRIEFSLIGRYERDGVAAMSKVMESILDAVGARDIQVVMKPSNGGHYMGGHRMGDDPNDSTTDSFLECHDNRGLFLASGGAFPTGGTCNPTLTTTALVFRMVDHMLSG